MRSAIDYPIFAYREPHERGIVGPQGGCREELWGCPDSECPGHEEAVEVDCYYELGSYVPPERVLYATCKYCGREWDRID